MLPRLLRRLGVVCGTWLLLFCGLVGTGVNNTICECSPGGPGVPMGGGSNVDIFGVGLGALGSVCTPTSPGRRDSSGLKDPMSTSGSAGSLGAPGVTDGEGDTGTPETELFG